MITRFYVDNYKCLVNFEYKPKPFELIIGANGSGKTTVFEALNKLREFIVGDRKVEELFSRDSRTRWDTREEQRFELDFTSKDNILIRYLLVVDHSFDQARVKFENFYLSSSAWIESQLVDTDNASTEAFIPLREARQLMGGQETVFPVSNPSFTIMKTGMGGFIYSYLRRVRFFRLQTEAMSSLVVEGENEPTPSLSNFASYYSHLLQENQGSVFNLVSDLREVLIGLDQFALPLTNQGARKLMAVMNQPKKNTRFAFDELSDGQRALIALYMLIHCTLKEGTTLLIDEPENYVSMRELQPWLMTLEDKAEETGGQVILISHNPEIVNMLAPERAILFERNDGGPVTVRPFEAAAYLTLAETIARGWES